MNFTSVVEHLPANETQLFELALKIQAVLALTIPPVLLTGISTYGSVAGQTKGRSLIPNVNGALSWYIMELTVLISFWYGVLIPLDFSWSQVFSPAAEDTALPVWHVHLANVVLQQVQNLPITTWVFIGMFLLHYANRALIYPFRSRKRASMPLHVLAAGITFNIINGYTNGRGLTTFSECASECASKDLTWWWIGHPARFAHVEGFLLFFAGFIGNIMSDNAFLNLRERAIAAKKQSADSNGAKNDKSESQSHYVIPTGFFLFNFVSSPHYLCELLEWFGFAMATGSTAGWLFVALTAANLVPRAIRSHQWYKERFPNYPQERRAIIPFVL
ncbi:hypothetical protein GQ42DRAFT_161983 [Ramicandelaber brevisporus]|nr:hypothetical protein GQ42DRAFT_161983 [Ramicandelaber brevisporus]